MNKLILGFLLLLNFNVEARLTQRVVYGEDNRTDVAEAKNNFYVTLSKSTAAMIPTSALSINGKQVTIEAGTLQTDGICADERFSTQPTAAMCSGFLVGKQYLLTAGHCITSQADCDSNSWVFDYSISTENSSPTNLKDTSVYRCSQIVSRSQDRSTQNDFALIKLDREVVNRAPLSFRTKGKVALNASLVVIGHPSGLPTKISDDAFVRSNENKIYFQANLDTYGGNSGSAVFDTTTGVVEGILVRGERDYEYDSSSACSRSKKCKMDECRGEDVTRISSVTGLNKI